MTHQIALNFEDGVTRFVAANAGETVADAAYRQGINIPLDCRDGACGTCKCFAEAGRYDLGEDYIDDALTADEAEQGFVLTCQMRALSDCVVRVPASSQVCRAAQATFTASISAVRQLSDSTIALSIKGEALSKLAFLPGQYVNLAVPGSEQSRAYSFSSLQRDGEVSFLIRNVPGGLMSSFLTGRALAGDSMSLAGPLGSFYLRDIRRPLLLLAGGTGTGGIIGTVRFDCDEALDAALLARLEHTLPALLARPAIVAAPVARADLATSRRRSAEQLDREDNLVPRWVLLVEGSTVAAVEGVLREEFGEAVLGLGGTARSIHRLQHDLTKR